MERSVAVKKRFFWKSIFELFQKSSRPEKLVLSKSRCCWMLFYSKINCFQKVVVLKKCLFWGSILVEKVSVLKCVILRRLFWKNSCGRKSNCSEKAATPKNNCCVVLVTLHKWVIWKLDFLQKKSIHIREQASSFEEN